MDIFKLKRGFYQKMINTQSPKRLWDHFSELEDRIRSCTTHDHYSLDGKMPETVMKGHTLDITTVCEYEWYEWVMYNGTTCKLPDPKFVLGLYLGPAIDVGYAMNSKVLKNTGEVFPLSTLSTLSIEETDNTDLKEQHLKFDESVIANLGDTTTETDLPDKDSTPTYDTYVNDMTEGTLDAPDEDLEPTPEAGDKYVNTDVMLPHGGTLLRGRVIECKRDDNGNPVGRSN